MPAAWPAAWAYGLGLRPGPAAWACGLGLRPGQRPRPTAWACGLACGLGLRPEPEAWPAAWACGLGLRPGPWPGLWPGPAAWPAAWAYGLGLRPGLRPGPAAWACGLFIVALLRRIAFQTGTREPPCRKAEADKPSDGHPPCCRVREHPPGHGSNVFLADPVLGGAHLAYPRMFSRLSCLLELRECGDQRSACSGGWPSRRRSGLRPRW